LSKLETCSVTGCSRISTPLKDLEVGVLGVYFPVSDNDGQCGSMRKEVPEKHVTHMRVHSYGNPQTQSFRYLTRSTIKVLRILVPPVEHNTEYSLCGDAGSAFGNIIPPYFLFGSSHLQG
jgi:hypothetical protein